MGGADLIAVNKSRYFQKGSDLSLGIDFFFFLAQNMQQREHFDLCHACTLGTGAFVAGLEFSADCQAVVVGKPSKTFFELGRCNDKYF